MQRTFKTEQEFYNKAKEYINYCKEEKELPNIAGFCVYNNINRDTYYAQKDYYSDTFKKVEDLFEDGAINARTTDTLKIFYLKNKFDYTDKKEIEHSGEIKLEDVL